MSKLDEIIDNFGENYTAAFGFEVKAEIKDLMLELLDTANPLHDQNWYWKLRKEVEAL